ncbi:type II toxin-antitoxin system Phd/YefM family antitoxin [Bordetella genomosp. 9]|uniref:type II toxin-antitoxin system Phd/YefM family antitoxin n=1 Tax=Bordetella genomosp. 9 TaxID=1416803 RepID=UPI00211ACEAB|nr:type II toxin-antitoxin system Phd/YefM family antitoxin [Bordetella genomosp. 9]
MNIHEAKTTLSKLIEAIELGKENDVVIARNGRPAAKLVAMPKLATSKQLGVAMGRFEVPDDIDGDNDQIADLFSGGPIR